MRKLLRANGSRLLRDRAFWLLAALMAALGASMAVVNAVHARQDGEIWTMDYTLFIYVILAPILASVFTALFIGNEHSSGAMRNKLIAGHRRGCIYLADLLVSCCAGICLCLAFALPPAESPSTRKISHLLGSRSEQSASLPGRLADSSTVLRRGRSRALRAASRARAAFRQRSRIALETCGFSSM